jgi:hypothetical protein
MKMQTIIAIACLGLLISVEPASAQIASAQKEYPLRVSVHEDVRPRLTKEEVEEILLGASQLLKDKSCDVTFKLNGPVQTFASRRTPAVIETKHQRNAVHRIDAEVKVVQEIKFCNPSIASPFFTGCAFPFSMSRKSMIVARAHMATVPVRSIQWAHEFGHRTGLRHRADADALMTACSNFSGIEVEVNSDECHCFLRGPENQCTRPNVRPVCSDKR